MAAQSVTELPEGDDWLYELKLDGSSYELKLDGSSYSVVVSSRAGWGDRKEGILTYVTAR